MHANSTRISSAVRTVLRLPADNLRVGLDQSLKDLNARQDETVKVRGESERAIRYFRGLADGTENERARVQRVDLDAPPPGLH